MWTDRQTLRHCEFTSFKTILYFLIIYHREDEHGAHAIF